MNRMNQPMKFPMWGNSGETYRHTETCPNCKRNNNMDIPKGRSIREYLSGFACTFCGCDIGRLLKQIWS